MTALQVVGKVITMALTTEQTRELYIVMIPSGGSPTIAPALQHLHDLSNSTLPQGPKQVLQKDSVPKSNAIAVGNAWVVARMIV